MQGPPRGRKGGGRVLEVAREESAELVVLGTRGTHGFERWVSGSAAEAVLRRTGCPVLTAGPLAGAEKEGPVVFATDFHRATTGAARPAATLSRALRTRLHCLHVLPRSLESSSGDPAVLPHILNEALGQVAQACGAAGAVCAVRYGSEVSNAVVAYAREHQAQAIVLGVRRASLLAAHAHIAYRIAVEAPCPVMTVAFAADDGPGTWA